MIAAVGGGSLYNESLTAAMSKWNGSVPQMVLAGEKGGPATFLRLPVPALQE